MAVTLAQDGKSVKVCVQEAMGAGVFQGLPLSLSGVKRCAARHHSSRQAGVAPFVRLSGSRIHNVVI